MERNMSTNKADETVNLDDQYRTMLILWFAFLSSDRYVFCSRTCRSPNSGEGDESTADDLAL